MNALKSQPVASESTSTGPQITGKYLIVVVFAVALTAAAMSWWVRYNATRRVAQLWGPEAARLIRDAPEVKLFKEPMVPTDTLGVEPAEIPAAIRSHIDKSAVDISHAPGLVHLRHALLEDSNIVWPADDEPRPKLADDIGYWWLHFIDPGSEKSAQIWFTRDCRQGARLTPNPDDRTYRAMGFSTEPIAKGLREMFAEFSAKSAANAGEPPR